MHSDRATTPARRAPLRLLTAAAAVLALGTSVAACDSAATSEANTPSKGGILRVFTADLPTHLDPQKISLATDSDISRLITRTLTTTKAEPGSASSEIIPDLATDTGRPSDGNKTWEFKLKDGVKWEDGAAINCAQLKFGAERNFSTLMSDGLPYARIYLDKNPPNYAGPFLKDNNGGKGLESVECVDARTIRYHLKQPVGDFGYTAALTVLAPVRAEIEGKDRDAYDKKPFATGPYKVSSRDQDRMTLVRNENWDPSTDSVRKAYPDQIVVIARNDAAEQTNRMIADQGEERNGVMLDQDVAPNFLQQVVNDPDLAGRTASGPTGGVRYFAINTQKITNLKCRQGIEYAFDKRKFRTAMGGSIMGEVATSMIPKPLAAHKEFDVYGNKTRPDGDPEKAAELFKQAGKNVCPKELRVAYRDGPVNKRLMKPLTEMFLKVGIKITPVAVPSLGYYTTISEADLNFDLIYAGWLPDFPNGSAVIPPLFDGRALPKPDETGTLNFSFYHNEEIERLIDEATAEPDLDRQYKLWGELDQKLMEQAVVVPVIFNDAQRIYGSNVTGVFISAQYAMPDLSAIGLKNPSASTVS
jgi:peptide/nickel transport system substrate-binding protein